MNAVSARHVEKARAYLEKAQASIVAAKSKRASKEAWTATSEILNAFAVEKNLTLDPYRQLYDAVDCVVDETGDKEFHLLFTQAHWLKDIAEEGFFNDSWVGHSVDHVAVLVNKVEGLLNDG